MNEDIKILFSGDFVPSDCPNNNSIVFEANLISLINTFDLHITNLECPLTLSESKIKKSGPHIKARPDLVKQLLDSQVSIACLANNHIFDFGEKGLLDTIEICEKNNIETIGIVNRIDGKPSYLIKNIRNKRVGLLNYCESEFSVRDRSELGANGFDFIKCFNEITDIRKKCDYLILIFHGGNEMFHLPNPWIKELFHFFIDLGADAVISHHTHVISGYEIYKNKPIFYGIGNFFFLESENPEDWYYGILVGLTFHENEIDFEIFPIQQIPNLYKIRLCGYQEEAKTNRRVEELSKIIKNDGLLKEEWDSFTNKNMDSILKNLLNLKRYERFLIRCAYFRKKIFEDTKLLAIYDIIKCESHKELLLNTLENKMKF